MTYSHGCIIYFTLFRNFQGYTPLHLAVQFGKDNIFELLCNVYSEFHG